MADYMSSQLGPLLIALVLSGILCGCALVQTYMYCKPFPKDSWKLRTLVPRRTFQTIHLAFLLLGVWQTVMTDYAQRPQILVVAITAIISTVFGGLIAFFAFFVFRLYTFSHKKALPIFCSFLVITQFIFTLVVSISTVVAGELSQQPWQWFIVSALFITICADTTIVVSMSYYLKANETGFCRTSRVIDRMVLYIMGENCQDGPDSLIAYLTGIITRLNARAKFSHELQHPGSGDGLEVSLSRLVVQDHQTTGQGQTIVCTARKETLEADNEECEEFERVSRPWM
ncbi:hypothetical protein BKA82DRAFT_4158299 [Pisolithus tinctorius]|nr:hypothetical protein BKA82DRAFT_4158299 [Pisolithus tinctorius]